jgi:acyl dehydratase
MIDIRESIAEITSTVVAKQRDARDPVNEPTIKTWVEALGDRNPIYTDEAAARAAGHPGLVAPPAMIQVWTMFGLSGERPTDDPMGPLMELFDGAGYVGVVATNCEQTYHRYLRPGEQVSIASEMRDVVGPKQTALGEGWFINQHITWRVGDEDVAEMAWRILKFKPRESDAVGAAAVPADLDSDAMMRPALSRDTAFFWEGVAAHELRIRRCPRCGRTKNSRSTISSPAARARCTASWCTTRPRCRAAHCPSSSPWSSSKKGCACWVSCATSIMRM